MFGLKGRDVFNRPTTNFDEISKKIGKLWIKSFPYILLGLIIVCIVIMGYVWYTYLHNKDITEEQKNQYINKKNNEVTFKKEKFNELKNKIILRNKRFKKSKDKYDDIFYHIEKIEEVDNNIRNTEKNTQL